MSGDDCCLGCTSRYVELDEAGVIRHNCRTDCPAWAAHEAAKPARYAQRCENIDRMSHFNESFTRIWRRKGSLGRRTLRGGQR